MYKASLGINFPSCLKSCTSDLLIEKRVETEIRGTKKLDYLKKYRKWNYLLHCKSSPDTVHAAVICHDQKLIKQFVKSKI